MSELDRFFLQPGKPFILSLCRPDKRKNIAGLIKAYGEDENLQSMANLAIFAGIRKDISKMEDNERAVLTEILLLMDKYDLYGKIAIPKKHDFETEVPELYRLAAEKEGVFVNSALTEPFGITLIESAASGLPIIAPNDGGPIDIVRNCNNGILVDTTRSKEIAEAAKAIITDKEQWKTYSKNGITWVREQYTWNSHAATYIKAIGDTLAVNSRGNLKRAVPKKAVGRRLARFNAFFITDIDNTLIGGKRNGLERLIRMLEQYRDVILFGVATGRSIESARQQLKRFDVPSPDVTIASAGTVIYYGKECYYGKGWETHISAKWNREKIVNQLPEFSFLTYQPESTQGRFKVSYEIKPEKDALANIHARLLRSHCRCNLIYSKNRYLDILPYRASKGKAIRYLSYQWGIPLANFLVCGDSGSDESMLRGEPKGVVVGNYSPELDSLKGLRNIYFTKNPYSEGILEGFEKYQFFENSLSTDSVKA